MRGRTQFLIAHCLSTIRRADQILAVEAGRIIERGTHESLYAVGGRYYDLYTKQHGIETNLFLARGEGDVLTEEPTTPQREPSADNQGDGGLSSAIRLIRSQTAKFLSCDITRRVTNTFSLDDLTRFVLQFSLFALGGGDPSVAKATLCFH